MTIQYRVCPKCGCRAPTFTGQDLNHCRTCDGPHKMVGFNVDVESNETKTKWRVSVRAPDGTLIHRKKFRERDKARAYAEHLSVNLWVFIQTVEGRGARA